MPSDVDYGAIYKKVYEDPSYGNALEGFSPGARWFGHYKHWLKGPVISLGCGRGGEVLAMRGSGFDADGVDIIHTPAVGPFMYGNIAKPLPLSGYQTAVCIDVLEHIHADDLAGVLDNLACVPWQVIAVANHSDERDGVELHINRMPWLEWAEALSTRLSIVDTREVEPGRMMYFTEAKVCE